MHGLAELQTAGTILGKAHQSFPGRSACLLRAAAQRARTAVCVRAQTCRGLVLCAPACGCIHSAGAGAGPLAQGALDAPEQRLCARAHGHRMLVEAELFLGACTGAGSA